MQRDHTLPEPVHSDIHCGLLLISVAVGKGGCIISIARLFSAFFGISFSSISRGA